MTFSVVGRDERTGALGVAVASRFLAAAAAVPSIEAEVGAVATQAFANLAYGRDGLRLLAEGRPAAEVVRLLVDPDPLRDQRQVAIVGSSGDGVSFTGQACPDWAGHRCGPGYALQGNILAGPQVLEAMEQAWRAGADLPLAQRLHAVLTAGDDAGGDRRGRQSAGLLVVRKGAGYGGEGDVEVDLRVDDHVAPVAELGRLLDLHELFFGEVDEAALLPLTGPVGDEVRALLAARGHRQPDLDEALAEWAGIENFEMRLRTGKIDAVVLDQLRAS